MFPPPFMARRSFEDRDEAMKTGKRVAPFLAGFFDFFGKALTERKAKFLLDLFPPEKGQLFESLLCAIDWDPQSKT
jgi:hypothetical protein